MNQHGTILTEFLVLLIMIALTSATVLFLVKTGVVSVRADGADSEEVQILDAEFIPIGREGYLAIKEFRFCDAVDELYNCIGEKDAFQIGEEVHFRFVVESSVSNGEVMLVENYRLKGLGGKVILDVDTNNNYNYNLQSQQKKQNIYFKDYIITEDGDPTGLYTVEFLIENPLLNKRVTLTKQFTLVQNE